MRGDIALSTVLVVGGYVVTQIGGRVLRWVAGTSANTLAAGLGELAIAVGAGASFACLITLYRIEKPPRRSVGPHAHAPTTRRRPEPMSSIAAELAAVLRGVLFALGAVFWCGLVR